jgi:Protein of unknown function (DUF732)
MRKKWLVTAVAVLMLGGCGDEAEPTAGPAPVTSSPAPVTQTTAPASAAATATTSPTPGGTATKPSPRRTGAGPSGFVDVVRDRVPEVAVDRRDDEIEAVARQACASLAAGKDADALVAETRSLGTADAEAVDQATARELIKLAIDTVCPDQSKRVDEF